MTCSIDGLIEDGFEDKIYENNMGIPDISWISGKCCSEVFSNLTALERKFLIKYYLEEYNDRQIADEFGMYINSVNQIRRKAIAKVAETLNIDLKKIKRSRKSGRNAFKYCNNKEVLC